jgi:surface antigen
VSDIVEGFLVAGRAPDPAYRGSGYSVYRQPRLWRALWLRHPAHGFWPSWPGGRRAIRAVSAVAVTFLAGACGMSAKLGLPAAGTGANVAAVVGANVSNDSVDLISALSTGAFTDDDLIVAGMATTALLARGTGGPWENPQTGARGTITPTAAAYRNNGVECRDFLASYVHDRAEAWMQGEACRSRAGRWEVRSLKPWRR